MGKKQDSLPPAPPPPKKRNSSMKLAKQFVKLDIEPKLKELEKEKRDLKKAVKSLECENVELKQDLAALQTENDSLHSAMKEKDEEIKKLYKELKQQGIVNCALSQLSQSNTSDLNLNDESPPNSYMHSYEDDSKTNEPRPKRMCITCGKEIIGRALKTKDGLIHKECHSCIECGKFLLDLKYAVLWEDDKKVKLCEVCTEESKEDRKRMAKQSMARKQTFVLSDDLD